MKWFFAALTILLIAASPASAETRNIDYSVWTIVGDSVYARYTVPTNEAKYVVPPNSKRPSDKIIADYLLAHVAVTRGGEDCEAIDQGQDVGQINTLAFTPGFYLFEIQYLCTGNGAISFANTAFSQVPGHVDFARIQIAGQDFIQHIFTSTATRLDIPAAANDLQNDSFLRYGVLGFFHVIRSADILLFMAAIFLIARARLDYALASGGLACGYAAAFVAAVFKLAVPHAGAGVLFNALLIFLVAIGGLVLRREQRRTGVAIMAAMLFAIVVPAFFLHAGALGAATFGVALIAISALLLPNRNMAGSALVAASCFVFALLDGFVLPGDVSIFGLPGIALAPMAFGFNAGALIAEMFLPLCLAAIWLQVPKMRRLAPANGFLADTAAAAFVGCSVFWFVTRLYS